jgi:ribosomal protein L21E
VHGTIGTTGPAVPLLPCKFCSTQYIVVVRMRSFLKPLLAGDLVQIEMSMIILISEPYIQYQGNTCSIITVSETSFYFWNAQ